MNGLEVFQNEQFGTIRTIVRDGNPWFVAKDVCQVFGDKNHNRSVGRIDDEDKQMVMLTDTLGREQTATAVNESGLYALLFAMQPQKANLDGVSDAYPIGIQQRIEKLRTFKRWITHDVVPTIRRHGVYATPAVIDQMLADPDFAIRTLTALKEERAQREALESQIKADEPYTDFAKSIANSSDSIHIGDFAKLVCNSGINIGRTRLFRWLRERQYLMNDNKPYQRYVDQGLFKVKESCIHTVCGNMIKFTTLVTGKGQIALLEALKDEFGERLPCGDDAA